MISLILAMVWNRRSQAVTLALLALFAVASAVAAPAFLRAAEAAVAAGQIATALPSERTFSVYDVQNDRAIAEAELDSQIGVVQFSDVGPALADLPGFDNVYAAEYATLGLERNPKLRSRFVYRQRVCEHVEMVAGRCLVADGEVIVGVRTAERLKLRAGQPVTLTYARAGDPQDPGYQPSGEPKTLTVVGTYRVPAPEDLYWGTHGYFATDSGDRPGEPVFTDHGTLLAMDHATTEHFIDGAAAPGTLQNADPAALRAGYERLIDLSAQLGQGASLLSGLPDLLDRVEAGRAAARLIVPLLAVPLVLLACFCIFLAVGYGTEGRRPELAVVALRGTRLGGRWLLATGESLVAVLAGTLLGCVAGQLLVNLVATVLPGDGTVPGWDSLRYAPLAAGAALLAALLAQVRQLVSTVVDLLRRAPAVPRTTRALAVELGVAPIAVVAGVQLFSSGGSLTGLGLVAPALVMLALALLTARALLPVITRMAARAAARGRLGAALAGFQLARRPGAARLFALLVAAVAVAGYATIAVDVAAQGRAVEARLGTGAHRVLTVEKVERQRLLHAVRTLDRDGTFAMAATELPAERAGAPVGLAVDTPRLAAVAEWPAGAPPVTEVVAALRPRAPDPVLLPGADLRITITASRAAAARHLGLGALVTGVTGLGDTAVHFGEIRAGRHEYRKRVDVCQAQCRLNALHITALRDTAGVRGDLIVNELAGAAPAGPAGWRLGDGGTATASPGGLRVALDAPDGLVKGVFLQPVMTPYPLPVARTDPVDETGMTATFDGRLVPAAQAVTVPVVPRLGTDALLVDLEYADRLTINNKPAVRPQIWLNAAAPADVLDRVAAQGLVVVDDVSIAQARDRLDMHGPAIALAFYLLAGCLAVALAAGALLLAATIDRPRRVEDLSALRTQGLRRAALRQATLWTYPALVVLALLTGLGIALACWALTGWALPLAGVHPPDLPFPTRPRAAVLAVTGTVILVVLATVAFLAGRRTLKEIK